MGHLNGILARVGGNLNDNFQKSQMPGGLPGGGMLKLRFDRYINYFPFKTIARGGFCIDPCCIRYSIGYDMLSIDSNLS